MKQADKPLIATAEERMHSALQQYKEACAMQTQWLRAKAKAELGRELADALGVADDVSWPVLLQYVGGLVRANSGARKRVRRRKGRR